MNTLGAQLCLLWELGARVLFFKGAAGVPKHTRREGRKHTDNVEPVGTLSIQVPVQRLQPHKEKLVTTQEQHTWSHTHTHTYIYIYIYV